MDAGSRQLLEDLQRASGSTPSMMGSTVYDDYTPVDFDPMDIDDSWMDEDASPEDLHEELVYIHALRDLRLDL